MFMLRIHDMLLSISRLQLCASSGPCQGARGLVRARKTNRHNCERESETPHACSISFPQSVLFPPPLVAHSLAKLLSGPSSFSAAPIILAFAARLSAPDDR
ncbi:hypothetical protein BD414DRAFT_144933 [Trametes punicea]|nr:hypothetical protein BD414DRAFT_144933 [Trametes punicea]